MSKQRNPVIWLAVALSLTGPTAAFAQAGNQEAAKEQYISEPMPPGFQLVYSELEGAVFADSKGKTLYRHPGNGISGEVKGKPLCADVKYTKSTASGGDPYPEGLELPDLDHRPTCTQLWPPVLADASAVPVGNFTIVTRPDGRKQWAYEEYALYTSSQDKQPGDTLAGAKRGGRGGYVQGNWSIVGPKPVLPARFGIKMMKLGHMLTLNDGASLYAWDKDGSNKSNCYGACVQEWSPVIAPETAVSSGEWTVFERAPGVKQWAFRNHPLYKHVTDRELGSQEGSDVPGWHNVFTLSRPGPPRGFSYQWTRGGKVLADPNGRTVYIYNCVDPGPDAQSCDYPEAPQIYRFIVCGKGDPTLCAQTFPYILADKNAKSGSRAWSTMYIDPTTGRRATDGQPGALHVWAYRDRPVYTFHGYDVYGDRKPGDIEGDAWGEMHGERNGFKAFWVRDDFFGNDS